MFSVYIHVQTVYVARGIIIIRRNYKVLAPQVSLYIISGAWHEHPKSFQNYAPHPQKKRKKVCEIISTSELYICLYIDIFFWLFLPILSGKKKNFSSRKGGAVCYTNFGRSDAQRSSRPLAKSWWNFNRGWLDQLSCWVHLTRSVEREREGDGIY